MTYTLYRTDEYSSWFKNEGYKSQVQIKNRLLKIEEHAHFGHCKNLEEDLWELKFNDGRRIYYVIIPEKRVILLIGGNKNGQDKDIKRARSIFRKIVEH